MLRLGKVAVPSTGACKQACRALPRWARAGMREALGGSPGGLSPGSTTPPRLFLLKVRDLNHHRGSLARCGGSHSFGRDTRLQFWGGGACWGSHLPLPAFNQSEQCEEITQQTKSLSTRHLLHARCFGKNKQALDLVPAWFPVSEAQNLRHSERPRAVFPGIRRTQPSVV